MAKKATGPAPPTNLSPVPKPGLLDWSSKLILPALAIFVAIGFGLYGVYSRHEVERMKAEVKQHVEQERQANDDAQWLRVEIAKDRQRRVGLDDLQKSEAANFGEEVRDLWKKAVQKAAEETQKEASNNPWSPLAGDLVVRPAKRETQKEASNNPWSGLKMWQR